MLSKASCAGCSLFWLLEPIYHPMKSFFLPIIISLAFACTGPEEKAAPELAKEVPITDNQELIEIYENDQSDRLSRPIDWSIVSKRDSLREVRVYELLDAGKVRTSTDFHNAAMVFQHGGDSVAYGMAVKLMRKSIEMDSTMNKWLLAAAIDRNLLSRNKPQIYGTQFNRKNSNEPWKQSEMDTTQVTDAERKEHRVETLAEQRIKLKRMNSRKLSELTAEGQTIDEIIAFIREEQDKESKFDLSEDAINSFGYTLMAQEKMEEALKILKLNTELFPEGFNTWDSYGECLLELDRKEEAIAAYTKSLELNPENENAEEVIKENG